MVDQYIPIFIMVGVALAFGLVMGRVNEWFGPSRPSSEKLSTYESGMEPVRSARERFPIKFYMIAMLFIIFDIEVVFLYPWAVSFRSLGVEGFITMFVFIAILVVGYYYVWRKGALEWD